MSELGKRLKEAREEKQLSLDDLQATTKIQKRYLTAIEAGEFSVLPGTFYARAFIRSYAEAVGLDHEALFVEFERELPNPHENDSQLPTRSERAAKMEQDARSQRRERRRRAEHSQKIHKRVQSDRDRSFFTGIVPIVIAGLILVGIVAGVYVYIQKSNLERDLADNEQLNKEQEENVVGNFNDDLPKEPTPPTVDKEDEGSTDEKDINQGEPEEPVAPQQQLEITEVNGIRTYYDLTGTNQFQVEIRFSGRSYMDIENKAGKKLDVRESKEGDVFTYDFSAEEVIDLNIGAINHAVVLINGEELTLQAKPVHQHLIISFAKAD